MKKIITLAFTLAIVISIATCAFAQENIVYKVLPVEQYLETFDVQTEWHEVCRANGDDYANEAEPKPLKIDMVDGRYVVHFRHEDPSDLSRWSAMHLKPSELIIRFADVLTPTIQEVKVSKWYRFSDTKEDSGKPLELTKYLLIIPEDTIFE